MSVKSFKFVSPGVFVNEVDNSQMARLPDATGPVIIGRADRGPAMVPVKVESFSEFVEIFGEPVAGGSASDAWRQGNRLAPTYGAFAAQAYLKNGAPITFVRLLGQAHPDAATDEARAGWKTTAAYALKVTDAQGTYKLAAIIYSNGQKANPTGPTVTDGKIKVNIPVENTTAAAGSAASSKLTVSNFSDAQDDSFTLTHQDGTTVRTVDFDNTTSVSSYVGTTLTVGTLDITTNNELAQRIADEVNKLGTNLAVTATAVANVITFVCDDIGAMGNNQTDVIAINAANAAGIAKSAFVNGVDAVAGQTNEETFIVDFNPNSKKYIRKILNTNPTATNTRDSMETEKYFLGQSFDQHIKAELGTITAATLTPIHADGFGNYIADAQASKSPWVLSQFMGDYAGKNNANSPLAVVDLTKLFRLHSLYSGEWEQKNFKVSIADVKPSDRFNAYGSFTVLIRDASDNDAAMVVRERFTNCNLNPNSQNFIGSKIGDMQQVWEEEERRYRMVGSHPNQSKYVRVEVATAIETGEANAELIPFGFAAPLHTATNGVSAGDMPKFRFREATRSDTDLSAATDAFFGITTGEIDSNDNPTSKFDPSYQDLVKPFYGSEDMFSADGELFSLDLVKSLGTINGVLSKHATFAAAANGADTISDGSSINAAAESFQAVLDAGFDSFTMPMAGGLDGLSVIEVEPFCDNILDDKSAVESAPFNTISKAIDMVSDPEVVECNLMAIPGCSNKSLTGKLINVCENRGDALAIIDLEGDYIPAGWQAETANGEEDRLPNVSTAISKLQARALSSSYGCAFYPWVQVNDQINNRLVWMPPSVVALGTMASSAAKSELWFAPAGFTRGGLSNGSGGLPVAQVRLRLNSKQRDKLYEAGVNPIAQFPAEGIVVFGQKTLQMTPSALDRINVRRLMIHVKKEISRMASTVLFDQNVNTTWARFLSKAEPFLGSVKSRFGLSEYRIVLDETTTTPELVDRNIVYAKVFLKPARAIEFIAVDFVITNSGASFDD